MRVPPVATVQTDDVPDDLPGLFGLSEHPIGRSQMILLATDGDVDTLDLAAQLHHVGLELGHAKAIERKNIQPRPRPFRQIIAHVFARPDRRCLMPKL